MALDSGSKGRSRRLSLMSIVNHYRYTLIFLILLLSSFFSLTILKPFLHRRLPKIFPGFIVPDGYERNPSKPFPFFTGRLDAKANYKIYDWMWVGDKWSTITRLYDVCLATQGSLDRLHWLPQLSSQWNGPISLSIFIVSRPQWIQLNIVVNYLRKCVPSFRDNVVVHVVVPVEQVDGWSTGSTTLDTDFRDLTTVDCSEPQRSIQEFLGDESKEAGYPQNQLRNVATRGCGTPWIFSTDIDIIPRPQSADSLNTFLKSNESTDCKKCAFVIPTFEVEDNSHFPATKLDLVKLLNKHRATASGRKETGYGLWSTLYLEDGPVRISHGLQLSPDDKLAFMGPANMAAFPENGLTTDSRTTPASEDGLTFKILTPIFALHWDRQSSTTANKPEVSIGKSNVPETGVVQMTLRGKLIKQAYDASRTTQAMKPPTKIERVVVMRTTMAVKVLRSGSSKDDSMTLAGRYIPKNGMDN